MLNAPFQLLANGVRAVDTMTAFVMMKTFHVGKRWENRSPENKKIS
jgi:hypothetical protein